MKYATSKQKKLDTAQIKQFQGRESKNSYLQRKSVNSNLEQLDGKKSLSPRLRAAIYERSFKRKLESSKQETQLGNMSSSVTSLPRIMNEGHEGAKASAYMTSD